MNDLLRDLPDPSADRVPPAIPDPFALADMAATKISDLSGIKKIDFGIVMGSGWNHATEIIGKTVFSISASEIPGFSPNNVSGHSGQLSIVRIEQTSKYALVVGARTHLYEGKGTNAVAHPVRTIAKLGAKVLVLTNGCGGCDPNWTPGQPVLIRDHINLTGRSPLSGATFIDLTNAYSPKLRDIAKRVDSTLPEGVYVQFPGPHFETPAEVQMAKILGGNLVGMSTTLETIAAREAGMEVIGLSLVTNLAAGVSDKPISHEEVLAAGKEASTRVSQLLAQIVLEISRGE